MRATLALLALLVGCTGAPKDTGDDPLPGEGEGEGEGAGEGEGEGETPEWGSDSPTLTVDGQTCALTWDTSFGYCLESTSTFSVDSSASCGGLDLRGTVWLPGDALSQAPDFTLHDDSTTLPPGTGSVWVESGDQTWVSASGTATVADHGLWVSATFSGEFVDFITGLDPITASGTVWCERP